MFRLIGLRFGSRFMPFAYFTVVKGSRAYGGGLLEPEFVSRDVVL